MITVMGGGAFGTALAIALSANGPVHLWMRNPERVTSDRCTPRLPGISLPENVTVSAELTVSETVLLAVPMQQLSNLMSEHPALAERTLVACSKGMDLATGLGPTGLIDAAFPTATSAILTGPSFATDIATGLPTALTLACADKTKGAALQQALSTPRLRLYLSDDPTGAELGGALKNVIAIACGVCIGAGWGDSARAALMTRGFAEMTRFGAELGARPETLAGLSGLGDLALTCTSQMSRNFRYGCAIGAGETIETDITVEGAATATALTTRAAHMGLELPIAAAVSALVAGTLTPQDALDSLLARPLRKE